MIVTTTVVLIVVIIRMMMTNNDSSNSNKSSKKDNNDDDDNIHCCYPYRCGEVPWAEPEWAGEWQWRGGHTVPAECHLHLHPRPVCGTGARGHGHREPHCHNKHRAQVCMSHDLFICIIHLCGGQVREAMGIESHITATSTGLRYACLMISLSYTCAMDRCMRIGASRVTWPRYTQGSGSKVHRIPFFLS